MSAVVLKPPIARRPLGKRRVCHAARSQHPNPLSMRLARMMIDRYGADAIVQAATQGHALLSKGDVDGFMAWLSVIMAIGRLQATTGGSRPILQ